MFFCFFYLIYPGTQNSIESCGRFRISRKSLRMEVKKQNKKNNNFIRFFFIASYVIWCMFLVSAPGVGSLLARFQLTNGPSKPAPLAVQFTSEGSTLSGCDIELLGSGYRFSLIKKRFAAGENETSLIREHYSKWA